MLNSLQQILQQTHTTPSMISTNPFSYDLDGRCIRDDRYSYVYDGLGRLRQVFDISNANLVLEQQFDPLGRIMKRNLFGVNSAERIHYLGTREVENETSSGAILWQRCYGINQDELIVQSGKDDLWCHQDARLSLLAVSDGNGLPLHRYSYTPFGFPSVWQADGMTPVMNSEIIMPPIFGSHRYIGINGLYDARARIYDSATARFLHEILPVTAIARIFMHILLKILLI